MKFQYTKDKEKILESSREGKLEKELHTNFQSWSGIRMAVILATETLGAT